MCRVKPQCVELMMCVALGWTLNLRVEMCWHDVFRVGGIKMRMIETENDRLKQKKWQQNTYGKAAVTCCNENFAHFYFGIMSNFQAHGALIRDNMVC